MRKFTIIIAALLVSSAVLAESMWWPARIGQKVNAGRNIEVVEVHYDNGKVTCYVAVQTYSLVAAPAISCLRNP